MSDKPEDTVWPVPANTISGDEPADVRRDLERIVKATRGEPAALVAQPTPLVPPPTDAPEVGQFEAPEATATDDDALTPTETP